MSVVEERHNAFCYLPFPCYQSCIIRIEWLSSCRNCGDSTWLSLQPLRRRCPRRAAWRTCSSRRVSRRLSPLSGARQRSQIGGTHSMWLWVKYRWKRKSQAPQCGTFPSRTLSRWSPLFPLALWQTDGLFIFLTNSLAYPSMSPPKGLLPMFSELEMIYDVC